jgi:hypothetical protein
MQLSRLPHDPGTLVDFYQEALEHLGAVCERSWFDRLQLLAGGKAAELWNAEGGLHETELRFPPPDASSPRDAATEVFPGCPLTFHLAEALCARPLPLERAVLAPGEKSHAPPFEVAEKLWHAQVPGPGQFRMPSPFVASHHYSLLILVRCEIQAIDQHWSLHRLVLSLPGGGLDEGLAESLDFARLDPAPASGMDWPRLPHAEMFNLLKSGMAGAIEAELSAIKVRQENYLRRELDRVDDYFDGYERELKQRAARGQSDGGRIKAQERLAAARAEHARRRQDQVQRHEIHVIPHVDALVVLAEPAWRGTVIVAQKNSAREHSALFVPRSRLWVLG